MSAALDNAASFWRADLQLGFERQGERTVLAHRKHVGPLLVQRPFYPEGDVCHVYLVHPPGGIVGGDQLRLNATLAEHAHALITTPAATKFYRSLPDRHAVLEQTLRADRATLEWLPQETILFRDAQARATTAVHIDKTSRFIGWELTCYGRPASNELFDSGHARQRFELWIDGQPALLDQLRSDGQGASMQSRWGLAGHTWLGTLLAYSATADDLEAARGHGGFACTLVDRVLCCRWVGNDADAAKRAFVDLWRTLRPRIVARDALPPRIWAT